MRRLVMNNIIKSRRRMHLEILRAFEQGTLKDILPKLPKILVKDNSEIDKPRLYFEREIIKEKVKFALGLSYKKTKEMELYELLPHLDAILSDESELIERKKFVEVIDTVCAECPGGKYYVTDLCRNCIAHSCVNSCPRKAISIIHNRAYIDYEKCVNCGMCAKACPYHAIIKLEKPCQVVCGTNAIKPTEEGEMYVDMEKCSACGACYIACPFGAIETPSQILQVANKLKNGEKMVAIFAPSAVGQFGRTVTVEQIKEALKLAGFSEVYEVAWGADMVAEEEALHWLQHKETMLTSCCPAFVHFIKKNYEELKDKISPVPSPMVRLVKELRNRGVDGKVVFIGPCIAKKMEAAVTGMPDYVVTFEEIAALFAVKNIEPMKLKGENLNEITPYGWNFASAGGVGEAVRFYVRKHAGDEVAKSMKIVNANGLFECGEIAKGLKSGKLNADIFEGMACDGGCVAGPGVMVDPVIAKNLIKRVFSTTE